jgi:hypothetical protein
MFMDWFLRELPQLYNIAFFEAEFRQIAKNGARLATVASKP